MLIFRRLFLNNKQKQTPSKENRGRANARLTELRHSFACTLIVINDRKTINFFRGSIKRLRETYIITTKSDKANEVVRMDRIDDLTKLEMTLED